MKTNNHEQYGPSFTKKYNQTTRFYTRVLPGIMRHLPEGNDKSTILDLGCGNGMLIPYLKQKGYQNYIGIDISESMITDAKNTYPSETFIVGSADDYVDKLPKEQKVFDYIVSVMMLPAIANREVLYGSFTEVAKSLKLGGLYIANSTHPCFDPYMEQTSPDGPVQTEFKGYFSVGNKYQITRALSSGVLQFIDYHWPLYVMIDAITQSGLKLVGVDECIATDDKSANPSHIVYLITK